MSRSKPTTGPAKGVVIAVTVRLAAADAGTSGSDEGYRAAEQSM
jgi:hypothetical protein